MTSFSTRSTSARFSPTVFPVTVICPRSSLLSIAFITAGIPPHSSSTLRGYRPEGFILQRYGTSRLSSSKSFRERSIPPSWAIAGRWSVLLVDAPIAILTLIPLRRASRVMIFRGVRSSFTISTILRPDCLAIRRFLRLPHGPGRSRQAHTQGLCQTAHVLAVPSMEQVPTPGSASFSIFSSSSSVSLPV